jgi:phospholipid/cholesterol/gamma-HCH transport system ATP-binding protein
MEKPPIISVRNLMARYGSEVILENISFDIHPAEILVIAGGSGCGKSTLLRHMVGLNQAHSGTILIDGIDITACSSASFHDTLRKIAVLFQGSALIGSMTIAENVALPILEYTDLPVSAVNHLVHLKLNLVHLQGYENHLPSELSGGMKKRAGLARALSLNPKILFLDEPSAGLDPITSVELDDLILHINESLGTTMVIVTHELDSIFKVAHRVIMLDKAVKGIIAEGPPLYLKTKSPDIGVRRFFRRESTDHGAT